MAVLLGNSSSWFPAARKIILQPDLQEIYLGPADTGRPISQIQHEWQAASWAPDATYIDTSLLKAVESEEQGAWFGAKERLPPRSSVGTAAGRAAFARSQGGRFLEWLGQHLEQYQTETNVHSLMCPREMLTLVVGHRGALEEGLLPFDWASVASARRHRAHGGLRNAEALHLVLSDGVLEPGAFPICRWQLAPPMGGATGLE